MFSKSKKSKEGKVRNGKESPSHGPFSSMTASLPKNIFSGKSRKNSGGYVIADGGSQPSSSKNGQTMGSTEMMARSQTLSHSPGHGYYFEGVSHGGGSPYHSPSNPALSNANLSNAHGSPFSSPSHSGGKTNTLSSVRSLRERYEQESSPQLSDRSLERQIDRLQMLAQSESNPNISPRDFHSYSMSSSFSRERVTDREYPHMGARSLERDHNYPGRSRSMERPDYTTQLYNQEMRNFRDTFILDLEGQIADLSKECAKLHQELDSTKEKLSSSMNSIKTFWSPELKKERALRKEESAKYCLLNEQLKVAQAELKKQASVIQSLESQVSLGEDVQASTRISQQEIEILQREKDKQSKEILILRRTVDEMELRIDIQKQTLAARDESMKKLLEMLQSKGHSISNIQENQLEIESLQAQRLEDERKIKQLQNELSQQLDESAALKEEKNHLSDEVKQLDLQLKQMPASNHTMKAMLEAKDSRIAALEKDVQALEDRIMKNQEDGSDGSVKKETGLKDSLSSREKHLRSEVERLKTELTRKDAEIEGLKLKVDTLTSQQSENQQHITVLKDQVSAKDKQLAMLQTEVSAKDKQLAMLQTEIDEFIEKLKEKNSTIDKNDQKSQSLQSEKRRIENEVTELREQIETKDRKLTLLQRKIEALEEDLKEKDATISQLKASQSHIENTTTAIATLEETITEKERQIDRLKEQRDRAESEHQEECDLYMKRNHELKAQVDKLQLEITDRQTELCELREKVTEAGSDKFKSETRIKQLEQENREKTEEIQKLKAEVEEKAKAAAEKAVSEESEKKVTELMSQLEKQEEEVKTIKEEVKRSQAVITEMEEDKAKKEKEIAEMQDIIKEYKQKMGTLKRSQQIEKKKNAHLLEEARRREGDLNDDASQLKDAVIAKGDRIEELEEALKESVRITAEREMVMVEQQQQLEEAENKVAELTMELARNKSAENSARVNFLTKQLEDKEQKLKKLQSERHKHLEEVYEMKQEAIQAAMSEKDANIALLEMTSTKQRRNTEEIEKLNREKEKLQQQLKEVTQNRMKLIQKQERRSESLGRSKKSPSHKAKGASPDRVNPYVLTAPASLDS